MSNLLEDKQHKGFLLDHRMKVLLMILVQNFRDAMIILSEYPGISYGVGIAVESIAEPFCIPWQNLMSFLSSPNSIVCTISTLGVLNFGLTLYPNFSIILLANIAVFKLLATTLGAKYKPCKIFLFAPRDGPTSFPKSWCC